MVLVRVRWRLLGALLVAASPASCGLDWALPIEDAGVGVGPDAAMGPEVGVESGADHANADGGKSDATGDGSDAQADTAADADGGALQVCHAIADCPNGMICHFPDHLCGAQGAGVCIPPRNGCTIADPAVCNCDGTSAPNECIANSTPNPEDVSAAGNCAPFPFEWICGYVYCGGSSGPPDCERTNVNGEAKYDCVTPPGCGVNNGCTGCTVPGCSCTDLDAGAFIDCGP
jgi:hypothetical protein